VQTRGAARATDYAFLGAAPPEPWWRAYRDVTAFDHPTVLVVSDGAHWTAYLSGIPSFRVDAVGTVVRYTLVLDGPCGAADAGCVPAAVGAWIDDIAAGHGDRPGGRLATALDARFPADDVERWMTPDVPPGRAATSDKQASARVRRRVLAALATLPAPPPATDEPGEWIGAVDAPGPRAAFTARVAALVDGLPGRALLLNLVGGVADAGVLADPASPAAVLVESGEPQLARCTALRPVVEAKKAPPAARPTRRTGTAAVAGIAVLPAVAVIGMLAMTVLVVTLLVWLL
jgi:hypothetical protein